VLEFCIKFERNIEQSAAELFTI